jgi:cell division protein FtsZ
MKKYVDSFLVISNDRLREIFGNLTLGSAFGQADDILTTAAKGIAEIITIPGYINVDFKDVRTVMKDSGVAIMGSYAAEGDNRALKAVEGALNSPLLEDNEIEGARYILLNISSGDKEVTMDEVTVITDYIQQEAGLSADLIWGNCTDDSLGDKLAVTIIATGFQTMEERQQSRSQAINFAPDFAVENAPLVKSVEHVNTFFAAPEQPAAEEVVEEQELTSSVLDLFAGVSSIPAIENEGLHQEEVEELVMYQVTQEPMVEETVSTTAFEFELKVEEAELPFDDYSTAAEPVIEVHEDATKTDDSIDEQLRKSKERIMRLKDLSMKLRSSNGLQELENEPAYKRKQLSLDDIPHSSESQVSRFTLSSEEGITEIRPNNSFLHDNVD